MVALLPSVGQVWCFSTALHDFQTFAVKTVTGTHVHACFNSVPMYTTLYTHRDWGYFVAHDVIRRTE